MQINLKERIRIREALKIWYYISKIMLMKSRMRYLPPALVVELVAAIVEAVYQQASHNAVECDVSGGSLIVDH